MTTYYRRAHGARRRNATHHIATTADGVARCGARCAPPTWETTEDAPRRTNGDWLCWHCWRYTRSDSTHEATPAPLPAASPSVAGR